MNANESLPKKVRLVRIYSNEHKAWWAPGYCGYRDNPMKAGIFRRGEVSAKYPDLDYDKAKDDYLVEYEFSEKDVLLDMFALPKEDFRDKYMGILFDDEAEFQAFDYRVVGAMEATFSDWLAEVRPLTQR